MARRAYTLVELMQAVALLGVFLPHARLARGGEGANARKDALAGKLVSDIAMPRKNGWELLAAVRNDPRLAETPFLLLSCHGDFLRGLSRVSAGADDYIEKGIRAGALKERLEAAIARRAGEAPPGPATMALAPTVALEEAARTLEERRLMGVEAALARSTGLRFREGPTTLFLLVADDERARLVRRMAAGEAPRDLLAGGRTCWPRGSLPCRLERAGVARVVRGASSGRVSDNDICMDVRCRQCGTEYELDDARVAAAGTTVKCSNCGHVFKVLPGGSTRDASGTVRAAPGPEPTPPLGSPPSQPPAPTAPPQPAPVGDWMVKKVDGQIFRFKELTTLQKWIVERKVVRDDEISRTGRSWKKLGEIAELTSFFQVVEAAESAQRAVTASMMPQVHLTATPTGTFQAWPLQQAAAQQAAQQAAAQGLPAPPPLPAPPLMPVPPAPAPVTSLPPAGLPAPAAPLPAPVDDADVELDDDDPVLAFQRRRRRLVLAATVGGALVLGAIGVGVVVDRSQRLPPEVTAGAQQALALGDEASRSRALAAIEASTAPGRTALRARLFAEEARALRDALRLAEEARAVTASMAPAGTPTPTTLAGVSADAAARAEQRLGEAGAAILQSRAEAQGGVDAALAAATAALAAADLDAVAREAGLARELSRALHDDVRAVVDDELRLLVSLAEAAGVAPRDGETAAAVRDKLLRFGDARARAAAAIAGLVPVRIARDAALAQTPPTAIDGAVVAAARAAFSTLPAGDPRQEAGLSLLTALTTLPAPPEPDAPDAGPLPERTATPTPPAPADEPFDALMGRGEKAVATGRAQAAYDAFKRATAKNPGSAKAWLKFGWAALDLGRKSEAPRYFQRALAASPSLSEAQFGLAEALRFSGRTSEAVVAYKQYLEMDPTGKDAGIAKNAIKQLEE